MLPLSRRAFLGLTSLLLTGRTARAESSIPEFWLGHETAAGPGTIKFLTPYDTFAAAKLDRQITAKTISVISSNNSNSEFVLSVIFPESGEGDLFLRVENSWWGADSIDHAWRSTRDTKDGTENHTTFTLDRKTAKRVADAFRTKMHERLRLDHDLRTTWTFPSTHSPRSTDPITVGLRLHNDGKTPLYLPPAGRGPHGDNRFSFKIARNGQLVPPGPDTEFGHTGPIFFTELAPANSVDCFSDLRTRVDWTIPGRYTIDAEFQTFLSAKDRTPRTQDPPVTPADRAQIWDIALTSHAIILSE